MDQRGALPRHSFVLAGMAGVMEETFGSSCHGAGIARKVARLVPLAVVKG